MNTSRNSFLFALTGLLFVTASAVSFAADEKCAAIKHEECATPETGLKWAMSSAEVRQVMGNPDEIRSMAAPLGKAEIWVFNRPVSYRVEQIVVATVPIMSTTYEELGSCNEKKAGRAIEEKVGETIKYGNIHVRTVERVEVLLYNAHFVKAKITQKKERSFD